MVDFGTKILGTQMQRWKVFLILKPKYQSLELQFLHELESLLENGLIKGGDLNNAIVYVQKRFLLLQWEFKSSFGKDEITKKQTVFRQPYVALSNEAARHKLLDVVGDLALIGTRIQGK
jgi:UDP-3-O-[3-hydroxymyristoyl] N-acetylglucosamine deacetylase/3-hydroxyacyl-[acyl-carrier-protein] dehydratase